MTVERDSQASVSYFAHSLPGRPVGEWEPLEQHLQHVATLASDFAAPFGGEGWARAAGLWHDLGKYSSAFQIYLRSTQAGDAHIAERSGRVDHSSAGAQHSVARSPVLGHLLAYAIAGHHAGLHDAVGAGPTRDRAVGGKGLWLVNQLRTAGECPDRRLMREVGRFSVDIPKQSDDEACAAGRSPLVRRATRGRPSSAPHARVLAASVHVRPPPAATRPTGQLLGRLAIFTGQEFGRCACALSLRDLGALRGLLSRRRAHRPAKM